MLRNGRTCTFVQDVGPPAGRQSELCTGLRMILVTGCSSDSAGRPGRIAARSLVSRAALRLHVYAILASIEAGRPGFVTDAYLDGVTVDTSLAAIELRTAGLWERADGGYT